MSSEEEKNVEQASKKEPNNSSAIPNGSALSDIPGASDASKQIRNNSQSDATEYLTIWPHTKTKQKNEM